MPAAQAGRQSGCLHVTKTGDFEDVRQDLKDAIINRGLVIDYAGHVGKILERTGAASLVIKAYAFCWLV